MLGDNDRQGVWQLQVQSGVPGASRILRELIRGVTGIEVQAMKNHFQDGPDERLVRPSRPTAMLEAADLQRLDDLVKATDAPSRSAVVRFLVRRASEASHG